MILFDVNVVLSAHRSDHSHYDIVRPWFDDTIENGTFGVPDIVWASFIRLATGSSIFPIPTPAGQAFDFLRAVRAHGNFVALSPGEDHLRLFEFLCERFDAAGNLAADAYLAAIAIEQDCEFASLDRDFARFENLRWIRPGD